MSPHPVLIDGRWRPSQAAKTFRAFDPTTGEALAETYPVSSAAELETALAAADAVLPALRDVQGEVLGRFLADYADRLTARGGEIVAAAHRETALPVAPRLKEAELPRTVGQLRQAAQRAGDPSWRLPVIDTKANIRSYLAPLGPVLVIGPNNFPLAFNGISGGDFAAAIAAGNPVIAKGHPAHPTTTRLMAEEAHAALLDVGLPPATVQLVYDMDPADGLALVGDRRLATVAFTGSRRAGLALKAAADRAGKPSFLEMSSLNPVVFLPGALAARGDEIVGEAAVSCLMGAGQFCTRPGLMVAIAGPATDRFLAGLAEKLSAAATGVLFGRGGATGFNEAIDTLLAAGATRRTAERVAPGPGFAVAPAALTVPGATFLADAETFQTEAFGPAALVVVAADVAEAAAVLARLEGQLTGTIYAAGDGSDDTAALRLEPILRGRVGRLLFNKMPTGVAVSPAMHHGGPFPATGHPHFTSVGLPAAMRRFTQLQCYDNVPPVYLPWMLRDELPHSGVWRAVDGSMRQGNLTP